MMLPEAFTRRMQQMLGEEYPAFADSYHEMKKQALRFNPLKGDRERFLKLAPFSLTPVPWEENGFYFEETDRPGRHPLHEAGVYYIQEASAMAPVKALAPKPGERILDLCAAPGGKSTQIAAAMRGEGLLISNEIHPARARILSENMERMGVCNGIVLNHAPDVLAERFPLFFDRILVDAPCSGEGMFRKNEEATQEWSLENVALCAARQDEILLRAAEMLREGGRLVYSTCTFAPEENEGSISRFLKNHPEFHLIPIEKALAESKCSLPNASLPDVPQPNASLSGAPQPSIPGLAPGHPEWVESGEGYLSYTGRLWPHKVKGEGHFLAVLEKDGQRTEQGRLPDAFGYEKGLSGKDCEAYRTFEKETLKGRKEGTFLCFGEQLYLLPGEAPSLKKLKVLRPGLHLGTLKKNRFEPSHALALSLQPQEVFRVCELPFESREELLQRSAEAGAAAPVTAWQYLGGLTFPAPDLKGYTLITTGGYSLGFGKAAGGIMKNHYPRGLRKM